MRRFTPLCCALLLGACATAEPEEGGGPFRGAPDALVGGDGDGGVIDNLTTSRLVFFQIGADGWMASAAGTDPRLICENARPVPDAAGSRVLCVPASDDDPLTIYDVSNDLSLVSIADWQATNLTRPLLSPDGSRVVLKTLSQRQRPLVRVINDAGVQVAELEAFGILGFPRDDVVILDVNQPALWRIGMDPVAVSGSNAHGIGPEPVGIVYETPLPESKVFYRDADSMRAVELAEGNLAGAFEDRILVLGRNGQTGQRTATLLDVDDLDYAADIPIPPVPFDRILNTRLVSRSTVIIELRSFVTCGVSQAQVTTRTTWFDVNRGEAFDIEDTGGEGHAAYVDSRGENALIIDLDACGNPTGTGRVKNLRSGETVRLVEYIQGAISAATLSPDGRFLAAATADGVTIIDLASSPPVARPAGMGAPGGTEIIFR